ncbi:MAG: SAM-dependent chlorinase/fluorinase [Pseudomonadota bacterium]
MKSFQPSGVITFTTDFGHKGPFIGTMKGAILSRFRDATIVDISHETSVHWPAEAGFWISRSYQYFPEGTVHVAIVDPGVGGQRDIIVAINNRHCFIAPDNGLLTPLLKSTEMEAYRIDLDALEHLALPKPSATFHGRDIFAPVAAEIARGALSPSQVGEPKTELVPSLLDEAEQSNGAVSGVVVTVDNFGNLITNIDESLVVQLESPICEIGGHRMKFHRTYARVTPGEYLALINSFGVVEIARAEQSAALGLGMGRGAPVRLVEDH